MAVAVAIAGHAIVLGGWEPRLPSPAGERWAAPATNHAPPAWQVRQFVARQPERAAPPRPGAAQPAVLPQAAVPAAGHSPAPGAAAAAAAATAAQGNETRWSTQQATPRAQATGRPADTSPAVAAQETPPAPPSSSQPAAATAVAQPPIPTYRTAPPPSLALDYEIEHGGHRGQARLEWRIAAEPAMGAAADAAPGMPRRYALSLRGAPAPGEDDRPAPGAQAPRVRAALAPHWTSQGSLDADGIAPERFAVARRGRERHAANFRRDAGHISFSGPALTWPLAAGAQDRLSWIVQLAAIMQADPALAEAPDARVSMMVAGAHGDAGVWTFVAHGTEMLPGPGGEPMEARVFRRAAEHAHDADVEVALARAVHHLPLRLRLTRRQGGESTEFRLRALQAQ